MKDLIRRILKEEQSEPVLNKREISLFKFINDNKRTAGTQKELIKLIKDMLGFYSMPENEARMYYEIYTANFRPDGDYENLTKENFKDFREFKQRKVTNNTAYEYAAAKMPFKGSNVEGNWGTNNKNEWYYVIKSYGWYPIFLFIKNQWYRTLDTYSSATRKHMSHSNPVRYNSGLHANVIDVSQYEIERLMDGTYSLNDVETKRVDNFVRNKDSVTNQSKLISGGWFENAHRVNYMIKDVEDVNGKIKLYIKILKAGKMVDRKMIPDSNFRDNPELLDNIMSTIKQDLLRTYPKYLTNNTTELELVD
jgi:hypothetical protein